MPEAAVHLRFVVLQIKTGLPMMRAAKKSGEIFANLESIVLSSRYKHKTDHLYAMIFNFRIVSDEVDNFKREIKVDATATFLDLKNAICDSVGYDKNQMSSFFLCDRNWEKEKEITFEDMGSDADQDVWLMDESVLGDFIDDEGQKLLYVFDYMTDRAFFIEMTEIITGKTLKDPLCTLSLGQAPAETVDLDEFDAKIDSKVAAAAAVGLDDLDADFYGSDSYDPDEFDSESFDEMSFDDKF